MDNMLRAMLVDTKEKEVRDVLVEHSLETFYKALDCSCIDIVEREIDGNRYLIICDDEGLLKSNPKVSAIKSTGEVMLVGNLLIVQQDDEGELASLTDFDIEHIRKNVGELVNVITGEKFVAIKNMDY